MKYTYAGLVLAACLSIASTSLLAEVTPAPEPLSNISTLAATIQEHKEAASLHKKHVE